MNNLGESLRVKREERGLSLKDVELILSIRVKYLEALETENFDLIPGEVYVKGFLRNYAKYLDLNSEELVQAYKDSQQSQAAVNAEPIVGKRTVARKDSKVRGLAISYAAIVVLVVISAGYYMYSSYNRPDRLLNHNAPPLTSKLDPQLPPPAVVPSKENITNQVLQGVKVSVRMTAECWIQVLADGREVFEGVLYAGDVKSWEAKSKINIILGNAAGVELTVNDKAQAPLGKSGEVVEKEYTVTQ